jgi:sirohydrochlorin cobaltochelatase
MRDTTAALEDWLKKGGRRMGQLLIRRAEAGWELCHVEDAESGALAMHMRWQDARLLANLDDAGGYRPLKTAPTLRHGWCLRLGTAEDVRRALDYFYPAMLGVWLAHLAGEVQPVFLRETLGRQTGMYRVTQKLTDAEAQALIARTCNDGACWKTVLWRIAPEVPIESLPPDKFIPRPTELEAPMFCQEACNFVVAAARKVVKGET